MGGGPRDRLGGPSFNLCICFSGGQIVEASQRPGKPPVGLIISFGSSYLVNRAPWPLGAGDGSVVFGEEAVSLSDPCPHRQAAL